MAQFIVRAHPMAGSTCERAASRFSNAADSPPTSVGLSKCGVGKDLDLGMIWGPKPRNFSSAIPVHLLGAKNQYACNIFGFQNSSWSPSSVAWSSIPRLMQYYCIWRFSWVQKKVQNLNLPKIKTQELQFQSWRKIVVFHPFVAIQYNECRWMLILNRIGW